MSSTFGQVSRLVGVAEIAKLLGVSRQRVDQISREDPTFPQPIDTLAAGRVWGGQDVEKWARRTGRLK